MRIAQLTLNSYHNYGNILQKFALHHTIKKFTEQTEVLWLKSSGLFSEIGSESSPRAQCVMYQERKNWEKIFSLREAVRQSKFKDFENLHIKTRFNFPYLEDIVDEYDFFIVGSDQVWNPLWNPPYIFLNFVPRKKKIAYAASIGAPAIPKNKREIFKQGISDFNCISVREEDAVKIIKDLTGRDSIILLDPVLLLTPKEWIAVSQKPTWFKEKYRRGFILTYYLRKLPPPELKKLAAELDLPVINLLDTENYNHFTVGPAEFIWLFAHASLILTNSFHGVAFSILFERPFLNIESADDKLGISMSNRIITLLKLFDLSDRMKMTDAPLKIDFARRDEILSPEQIKAFKFLSEALGREPNSKSILGGG